MHCTERKYLNSCIISTDYNKIIGNFNITIILSIYYTCISQYYIIHVTLGVACHGVSTYTSKKIDFFKLLVLIICNSLQGRIITNTLDI